MPKDSVVEYIVNSELIMDTLKDRIIKASEILPPGKILGIYACGDADLNLLSSIKELKARIIYLPTFEEIFLDESPEYDLDDFPKNTYLINIKNLAKPEEEAHLAEFLSAEYRIIKPYYIDYFDKEFIPVFREAEEKSKNFVLLRYAELGLKALAAAEDDPLMLKKAYLCNLFCEQYSKGKSYRDSKKYKNQFEYELVWNIRNTEGYLSTVQKKQIIDKLRQELEKTKKTYNKALPTGFLRGNSLKILFCDLLKFSFKSTPSEEYDRDIFVKRMTRLEKAAFNSLIEWFGGNEGYAPLTQLTEEYGISRPVYKSVLDKLVAVNVAIVESCGPKGMYIRINDEVLLNKICDTFK